MNKGEEKRFLILGVGNKLLRDEGLGVRVIEYLQERFFSPESVSFVDGGTGALGLLSLIRDFDKIIIVDAVSSRNTPGTLYRIRAEDLPKAPPLMTTAHQLGIQDLLAIASLEGYNPEVVIIGMVPEDMSPGLELSHLIEKRIPIVVDMIRDELRQSNIDLREK